MLRVARIPYLNSAPFYEELPATGMTLLDLPPRELGVAARAGQVDAGILSLCDTFDLPGFEPLLPMGVACRGPVHSVLLFSRNHPTELGADPIAVTTETATSIRLLELLLREVFELERPDLRRAERPGERDVAALLIGDRALIEAGRADLFPHRGDYGPGPVRLPEGGRWSWMLDLGDAWWRWRSQPFVFARWMVRSSADPEARARLAEALESSLAASLRDLRSVAARSAPRAGLHVDAAEAYLRGFRYRFESEEEQAILDFREQLDRAPREAGMPTRP